MYKTGSNEEVTMNLIADYLCAELTRHGVEWNRNNRKDTYAGHVAVSNVYKPDLHLAIHSNAGGSRGCEVYVNDPTNKTSIANKLAEKLYLRIAILTPVTDRGIKAGTFAEIKQTKAPAVLIEVEFHDSLEGAKWIVANILPIGKALLLSCLEVAGVPYKSIDMFPDKTEFLKNEMRKIQVIAMEALR